MNFISKSFQTLYTKISSNVARKHLNLTQTQNSLSAQQLCFMGTKTLVKTNRAAAKRIRVRGSGSIKRNKGGFAHNTGYKTRARCNRTGQTTGIEEPAIEKRMRRLIGAK